MTHAPLNHPQPNNNNNNNNNNNRSGDAWWLAREDQQKKQEMDALIAQTLSGLTFEERQQQQELLHGVEEKISEDEAFIDCALQDLDQHLRSTKEGSMYEMAENMDSGYVRARPFRAMFLRANEYDAKASAEQMLRFFECKHELFGPEKLVKDITMQDLDEGDIASIETGWMQLAGRDRSGRQIIVHCGGLPNFYDSPKMTMQNHFRVQFYTLMKALQSKETQLRGIISIWFALGKFKNRSNGKGYAQGYRVAAALPQKRAAIHICVDEVYQYTLCNVVLKLMQGSMRARLRVHYGSQIECEYQMTTYGVMSPSLPLDAQGNMMLSRHLSWVQSCAMEENAIDSSSIVLSTSSSRELESSKTTCIIEPSEHDVLFNRGKCNNHAGNKRLRALVSDCNHAYDGGTDGRKRQIVAAVIDKIGESGGRFLKQTAAQNNYDTADCCSTHNQWEEMSHEEIRKKVMQSFRNRRRQDGDSRQNPNHGTLIVSEPMPNDVIFGKFHLRHPGTVILHRLIEDHFEEYESLHRGVKMRLVEKIIQIIKDQDCRFLLPTTEAGRWIEVSEENVKERISKSFRNYRRKKQTS